MLNADAASEEERRAREGLLVSLADLLLLRWGRGERDFGLITEARRLLTNAFKTATESRDEALDQFAALVVENVEQTLNSTLAKLIRPSTDRAAGSRDDVLTKAVEVAKAVPRVAFGGDALNVGVAASLRERLAVTILRREVHVASLRAKLGRVCFMEGDFEQSEANYLAGLQIFETRVHANHPAVGDICAGLAELCETRRALGKAELWSRKVLMVRQVRGGGEGEGGRL